MLLGAEGAMHVSLHLSSNKMSSNSVFTKQTKNQSVSTYAEDFMVVKGQINCNPQPVLYECIWFYHNLYFRKSQSSNKFVCENAMVFIKTNKIFKSIQGHTG